MAQLGALGVWRNFLTDKSKAVEQYKEALSLGYTKPIGDNKTIVGRAKNRRTDVIVLY